MPADGKLLTLMPTFQCNAECTHCGTISSPRNDTWLPVEQMLAMIDEAAALGFTGVVFSGGEPTLAGDALTAAMRRARLRSLPVRMVTNARWAVDDTTAANSLFEWMFAGLTELNISTGDEHARFVPLDNVIRAATAAASLSVPAAVIVEVRDENRLTVDEVRARLGPLPTTVVPWVWTELAASRGTPGTGVINRSNIDQCAGCDELFSNITVHANGSISPCCGLAIRFVPELRVGNTRTSTLSAAIHSASASPLLQRINKEGPERILAWAAQWDPRIDWEDQYNHRCHACIRVHKDPLVRAVLAAH